MCSISSYCFFDLEQQNSRKIKEHLTNKLCCHAPYESSNIRNQQQYCCCIVAIINTAIFQVVLHIFEQKTDAAARFKK